MFDDTTDYLVFGFYKKKFRGTTLKKHKSIFLKKYLS